MFVEVETHCHTISSGHAYSSIQEIIVEAKKKDLKAVAITDHGPNMPGGPDMYYFANQKIIPDNIYGVDVLSGVEANILDIEGKLDLDDDVLQNLDIVIASMHSITIKPGNLEYNTKAILKAMENPYVDIIGHSGNPKFPIDKVAFVEKAIETNTLIEINNSSFFSSRKGSEKNCIEIAKICKEKGAKIVCGSDSHISFDVGRADKSEEILKSVDFPLDSIVNRNYEVFKEFLANKGKKRFI